MTKIVEKLSLFLDIGARWMVAAIMFVTTFNVIFRLLEVPFKGAVEIVQLLNGLAIGLGLSYCATQGSHVAISFFTDKLPKKIQDIIGIIVDIGVASFLALTAWELYQYGIGLKESGEVALTLGIPIYPLVYIVAVGFAVYLLVVLVGLLKTLGALFAAQKSSKPISGSEELERIDII